MFKVLGLTYFNDQKLAREIDEKGHSDRNIDYEKKST